MVIVRRELVTFNTPDEVQVDITGVVNGGKHLKPQQVNVLVDKRGDDVVFFWRQECLRGRNWQIQKCSRA
jgi:UPF0176 protein